MQEELASAGDPLTQEAAEQHERSERTLERVKRVLDKAVEIIDDHNAADTSATPPSAPVIVRRP